MKKFFVSILLLFSVLSVNAVVDTIPQKDTISIYSWKIDPVNFGVIKFPVDTFLNGFQVVNPLLKKDISYLYLGNMGTAAISNNFFLRYDEHNYIFLAPFRTYFYLPFDCRYYNTKKPFTNLSFTSAGSKIKREESFRVIHTQNVNPNLNFGFEFNHILSRGQYQRQRSKLYTFTLYTDYVKNKYSLHTNWNINSLEVQENGGVENDSTLWNPEYEKTENIPVNLDEAMSRLKNNSFFLLQQYRIGSRIMIEKADTTVADTANVKEFNYIFKPKLQISHLFEQENNRKIFIDNNLDIDFYPAIFVDSLNTYDSIYNQTITNSFQIEILEGFSNRFKLGAKILFSNEIERYGYNTPNVYSVESVPGDTVINSEGTFIFYRYDTTYYYTDSYLTNNDQNKSYYSNNLISASFFNRYGRKGYWNISGKYYISGYKKEDYEFLANFNRAFKTRGFLTKSKDDSIILNISVKNRKKSPNFFFTEYYSNHHKWLNSFNDEYKSTLKVDIFKPSNSFEFGANYSLIQNYIYLDSMALPQQDKDKFYVWSAYLNKNFLIGKFHLNNKIVYQQTENKEVLRIPDFFCYNSTYFQHLIRFKSTGGSMKMQLGFDFYYHSAYYSDIYSPALGLFYQQNLLIENSKKIGDYPYFDLFLSLKIKRLRLLLKYDHINTGLFTEKNFSTPHYPMNKRVFKLGLSWSFYD